MAEIDLRTALVTLYDGDSTVQTTTGRTSKNLLADGTVTETAYPLATYSIVSGPKMAGTNGRRRIRLQVTVWADGRDASTDAIATCDTLMNRAVALFTGANLKAQGVDAAVNPVDNRRDAPRITEGIVGITNDFLIDLTL